MSLLASSTQQDVNIEQRDWQATIVSMALKCTTISQKKNLRQQFLIIQRRWDVYLPVTAACNASRMAEPWDSTVELAGLVSWRRGSSCHDAPVVNRIHNTASTAVALGVDEHRLRGS